GARACPGGEGGGRSRAGATPRGLPAGRRLQPPRSPGRRAGRGHRHDRCSAPHSAAAAALQDMAGAAMMVALAVAGLLMPVRPRHRRPLRPLPAYALDLTGGERELRGSAPPGVDPGIIRLRPQSRLELVLRPATDVRGTVQVSALVAPKDAD